MLRGGPRSSEGTRVVGLDKEGTYEGCIVLFWLWSRILGKGGKAERHQD